MIVLLLSIRESILRDEEKPDTVVKVPNQMKVCQ